MIADRARGFTLVEVVAALAVIGVGIVGMLKLSDRSQDNAAQAHRTLGSARLCATCVDRFRAGLIGPGEGEFEGEPAYVWRIRSEPPPEDAPPGLSAWRIEVLPRDGADGGTSVVVWRTGEGR